MPPARTGRAPYVALSGSPNAGPGVDEKTLPPPDRCADGIGVVDLQQGKLLKVLTSGPDPEIVAVSVDGTRLFVSNEDTAKASVVDIASGQITESFTVGEEPEGVSVEPSGGRIWVTSEDAGAVFVIDLAAHKVVKSVKVGPRPRSVAFLPDGSRAYVPSETGASLTVIDVKRLDGAEDDRSRQGDARDGRRDGPRWQTRLRLDRPQPDGALRRHRDEYRWSARSKRGRVRGGSPSRRTARRSIPPTAHRTTCR